MQEELQEQWEQLTGATGVATGAPSKLENKFFLRKNNPGATSGAPDPLFHRVWSS